MYSSKLLFSAILVCGLAVAGATAADVHWEHGFLIQDDGNDNPMNDPGCNERVPPTWYHVIGSFNWQPYSVDLTTIDPQPKYIYYIAWGGDGWDNEGYWDNLSFKIDGVEQAVNGNFNAGLKPWPHDGWGHGQFLYEIVNFGGSHGKVFHYRRTNSSNDGGRNWVRLYLNQCVEDAESLVLSGEVYLINETLHNPGWWCCVYGCAPEHGDYAGEIRVKYATECPECDATVTLCHVPPGNPGNAHNITVCPDAAEAHFIHHEGDYLGTCIGGGGNPAIESEFHDSGTDTGPTDFTVQPGTTPPDTDRRHPPRTDRRETR
jgi:hypothetical protein